jgi:hypothetical protein
MSRGKNFNWRPYVKKLFTLALSALLCTAAVVKAEDAMKKDDAKKGTMTSGKMMTAHGTVTKIDKDGKMMMMTDKAGKEMTMYWDDSTKVKGDMKEGDMATVKYMMSGDKMMAHSVMMHSGSMKHEDMKKEEVKK